MIVNVFPQKWNRKVDARTSTKTEEDRQRSFINKSNKKSR